MSELFLFSSFPLKIELLFSLLSQASSADSALLRYSLLGCRHTLAVYGLHTALLVNCV